MAAKKEDFGQQQKLLNTELREDKFHRVYLLCGEQAYLRLQNRDRVRAALLGDGDEMNVSVYTGMDVTAREVIDQAQTLPFFADRRVIILENSVFFSKKASVESDALADFIPEIPESASLIFVEESPDKRKKLYRAIQKNGFILNCEDLPPRMLGQWTRGLFKKAGLTIDGPVLDRFLETVGEDMMNIISESDKLIGYCMGRESVTADDISAVCCPQLKDRVFEMITAVSRRQKQKALSIYMDLIALRTPAQVILTLLQREYSRLLQIRELRKAGESGEEIAKRTGLSAWIIKKNYMPVIGKMDAGRLEKSLQYCLQADQDYKSGKIDAGIVVEMTIIRLCG
ncbi:MAG: DNA polymerase III subunit delta [Lachnospiraceae bacterium]|nr:DNA polymerase III subunit delta [Lachnospiraceae bacterium]